MAILTTINAIPLFSTEAEAVAWSSSRGLIGFHTHNYENTIGYMGGLSHNQALTNNPNIVIEEQIIIEEETTNTNSNSGSRGSGGGGGGGY